MVIIKTSKKLSRFSFPISIVNCKCGWNVLKMSRWKCLDGMWLKRVEEAANAMSSIYLTKNGRVNFKKSRVLVSRSEALCSR